LLFIGRRSYAHYTHLGCAKEKLIFSPYCIDATTFAGGEVDRDRLRQSTRQSLGLLPQQLVLLFSGKLSPRKGPDLLIRAAKQLTDSARAGLVLAFLGSGEMRGELEHLAQQPPAVQTVMVGFQNQTHLSQYYHAADLLVLPSRHSETWGLVVNEGLHHGVPCVVSDAVGCAPDLARPGRTGEVCSANSVSSLASALERAFPLVRRLDIREQCRTLVDEYSVQEAAAGIARAYREVVDRAPVLGRRR
jgi:glycosyltransferase involved in cell wall biosynthesis